MGFTQGHLKKSDNESTRKLLLPSQINQRNATAFKVTKSWESSEQYEKKQTFESFLEKNCRNFRKTQNRKSDFTCSTSV